MNKIDKWIIDTNVVVHWLMAERLMNFAIDKFHLDNEFGEVYSKRYKDSVDFINKVLELPMNNHRFFITELSMNELFSGVRDEIRTIMLFIKGVPISRWMYKRETKETKFPELLSREIYELIMQGFDNLFGSKKIEIIDTTIPSDVLEYFEVYSSLVFLNPDLRTQDSILIVTAIFEKTNHFVTTDNALIRLGKILKENFNLEVVKPKTAVLRISL